MFHAVRPDQVRLDPSTTWQPNDRGPVGDLKDPPSTPLRSTNATAIDAVLSSAHPFGPGDKLRSSACEQLAILADAAAAADDAPLTAILRASLADVEELTLESRP